MNDQYYTREPHSDHNEKPCVFTYRGKELTFLTDAGVFSKGEADKGSILLLSQLPQALCGTVLDMGCGWGLIGLSIKNAIPQCTVTMADVNLRALSLTKRNAQSNQLEAEVLESNGFSALSGRTFDTIVTNPPIRAGKQVIYKMFADAAHCLNPGGKLYLVIRKQQGAPSALTYLKTLFETVTVPEKDAGFWVFCCENSKG